MQGSSQAGAWATVDSFPGNHSSPTLTMHRPCPVCGADAAETLLELSDFQMYSDSSQLPKRLDLRQQQCRSCFTLYMNPVYSPYGFSVLFAEAGQSYGSTAERPAEQLHWLGSRGLLDPGKTVLDVGCFEGRFLELLPEGLTKVGVDIDEDAIERGRARMAGPDVELIHGDFETFQTDRRPDTMTMFHVLEHVPNPVGVLRKLRSLAHAASRLVIEVPVVERGATNDLVGFFSVQHTTHFSRRSLQACLRRGGWEPIEWTGEEMDYNACRVLSGPAEAPAETATGNPEDFDAMLATLGAWHQAARDVSTRLRTVSSADRCVVWGAGNHLEYLYHRTPLFHERRGREYVIVDSDPKKHGTTWRGIPVMQPSLLPSLATSGVPVVISTYGNLPEISDAAIALGLVREQLVALYDHVNVY
jgi:2-polyprenyl-3-methyl-5-hydroxy-6-metoxy-1,4-benzoquinol methylase